MNTEIKRFITYGFFRFSPIHKYKTVNKKYVLKKETLLQWMSESKWLIESMTGFE